MHVSTLFCRCVLPVGPSSVVLSSPATTKHTSALRQIADLNFKNMSYWKGVIKTTIMAVVEPSMLALIEPSMVFVIEPSMMAVI